METGVTPITIEIVPSGPGDNDEVREDEQTLTAYIRTLPNDGEEPTDFYFEKKGNADWFSFVSRTLDAIANPKRYRLQINITRDDDNSVEVPSVDDTGEAVEKVTHYYTEEVELLLND